MNKRKSPGCASWIMYEKGQGGRGGGMGSKGEEARPTRGQQGDVCDGGRREYNLAGVADPGEDEGKEEAAMASLGPRTGSVSRASRRSCCLRASAVATSSESAAVEGQDHTFATTSSAGQSRRG